MRYIQAAFHIEDIGLTEVVMAVLAETGFTAFEESGTSLFGYIPQDHFDLESVLETLAMHGVTAIEQPEITVVEERNWNAEWESQFEPVAIARRILVRASFHPPRPEFEYDIVVDPKMSFGTGHHETTNLMLTTQLEIDHLGKRVLDVGTGTGILAIFALMRGAAIVEATDVEDWSIQNSKENFRRNGVQNPVIHQGAIKNLTLERPFDIVLANINKNVLLEEMDMYRQHLKTGGKLLISGFYTQDSPEIIRLAQDLHLHLEVQKECNGWAALLFCRQK